METNQQKKIITGLSIGAGVLLIALIITSIGWAKTNRELQSFRNGDGQLVEIKNSLELCNNPETLEAQVACVERLSQLSKLLAQYDEKLRSIKVTQ
jgi:hypothetical protein